MEKQLLRFLGAAFLLLHPEAIQTKAAFSEESLTKTGNKQQRVVVARQDEEKQIRIFTGTIVKSGDTFTLNDTTNKVVYQLDDAEKARQFDGKKVSIKGTLDPAKKLIHVQAIEEAA